MGTTARLRSSYDEIDDQDRQIIAVLKQDGRASNPAIARRLNMSPAAVGARIHRLERERMLRIVLVADFDVIGCELLLVVGIKVEHRDPREVANDLAALPEVFSCSIMIGTFNVEALVALPDMAALQTFLEVSLARISGIREISIDIAAHMLKYEFDVVPFTRFTR